MDYKRSLQTAVINLLCLIEYKLKYSYFVIGNIRQMYYFFLTEFLETNRMKILCTIGLNMVKHFLKHVTGDDCLECR